MNWVRAKDDKVQTTATTIAGTTASLLVQAAEDFDEIIFRIPIATITGSPKLVVSSSDDNSTYTDEVSYTRSNADNGKVIMIAVQKPRHAYYQVSINLNSGALNIAVEGATVQRYRPRAVPFTPTTCVQLTHVAL